MDAEGAALDYDAQGDGQERNFAYGRPGAPCRGGSHPRRRWRERDA
jgi:hypothetical protein